MKRTNLRSKIDLTTNKIIAIRMILSIPASRILLAVRRNLHHRMGNTPPIVKKV